MEWKMTRNVLGQMGCGCAMIRRDTVMTDRGLSLQTKTDAARDTGTAKLGATSNRRQNCSDHRQTSVDHAGDLDVQYAQGLDPDGGGPGAGPGAGEDEEEGVGMRV